MTNDEPELPDLQSALLSEEELERLFRDLHACAEVHSVRVKAGERDSADAATISLDEARVMLTTGRAQGVQIRYTFQGREYADTLLRSNAGFRLIRL